MAPVTAAILYRGFFVCALLFAHTVFAKGVYLSQQEFLSKSFGGADFEAHSLWLSTEQRQQAATILGHDYHGLRLRYWVSGSRQAWIIDEIGKELPITIGIVTERDDKRARIVSVDILEFRESRGGEVRYPAFTRQFTGAQRKLPVGLTQHIDGISGATLSVRAVTKVAQVALMLAESLNADEVSDE